MDDTLARIWVPVEAIDVAFLLAFIPYFVLRGPVNRIATIWIGHHRDS
jgi:hypothetical protein